MKEEFKIILKKYYDGIKKAQVALHKKRNRTTGKVTLKINTPFTSLKITKKIKPDKKKNPWHGVIGDGVCLDL